MAPSMPSGSVQRGFTYIGLLMMIAVSGIGFAALGEAWHTASQREKEKELLFAGGQIQSAIQRYYQQTPSPIKQYPARLEDLLLDKRGPKPQHHLRRIYIDPMTASRDWGLIKDQERIVGIYSRSKARPFKQDGFDEAQQAFSGAESYQDWEFSAKSGIDAGSGNANDRSLVKPVEMQVTSSTPSAIASRGSGRQVK